MLLNSLFVIEPAGLMKESSGYEECDHQNIQDWPECDVNDPYCQALTVYEITVRVLDYQDPYDDDEVEKESSTEEAFH
ncbi:hypothetical protein NPIL_283261 [Nephila pilipes]|uniref:Uncharacterized protein n=1 Tax=Nephila pilipes TaxID=299642 RepID=A0A8X6TLA2_NEPPI|nr:hypothetical protein NPIL_283261 [Nephila pilipes]